MVTRWKRAEKPTANGGAIWSPAIKETASSPELDVKGVGDYLRQSDSADRGWPHGEL